MELEREIDRLFKRLEVGLIGPDVACIAVKHLVRSQFAAGDMAGKLMVFEQWLDALFDRYRFLEIGIAVMTGDIKARLDYLREPPVRQAQTAEVVWL
ncbi:MAG: hypothetical protein ACXU8U_04270 [Asticcacaulis sp.]